MTLKKNTLLSFFTSNKKIRRENENNETEDDLICENNQMLGNANDIGYFVECLSLTDADKKLVLTNLWVPDVEYKFPLLAKNEKRGLRFQHKWLKEFNWLAYSNGFFVLCILIAIPLCIFNNSMITDSSSIVKATFKSLLLLFLLCLILYFNNKLKKAAYVHNLLFIRQWLMFHCTFYALSSILLCYCLFTHPCKIIVATVIIIIVMEIYQIHIVKRYYNNELEHLATSNCNIDKQSIIPIFPRVIQMEEMSEKYTQYKCIKMSN